MATKKPMKKPVKRVRRFQEGGETADKMAGLAASNKDAPMGFFERLRMGNIDQEGSQAYNRLGAGRAKMDRDAASELAANRMVDDMNASRQNQAYGKSEADVMDAMRQSDMMQRGRIAGEVVDSADKYRDYTPIAKPAAAAQNAAILASKPRSTTSSGTTTGDLARIDRKVPSGPTPTRAPGGAMKRGALSNEAPAASSSAAAPAAKPAATSAATTREERQARIDQAFKPPSDEQIQKGLEAGTLGAGFTLKKIADLAKNLANRKSAMKDRLRLDRPGTVSGEGFVMRDGKIVKDVAAKAPQKALPSPITDVVAKKRGGAVKKMAHGGSVKSSVSAASKRGDGIALRGKTRGKIY
jgi:hypothetical protein